MNGNVSISELKIKSKTSALSKVKQYAIALTTNSLTSLSLSSEASKRSGRNSSYPRGLSV